MTSALNGVAIVFGLPDLFKLHVKSFLLLVEGILSLFSQLPLFFYHFPPLFQIRLLSFGLLLSPFLLLLLASLDFLIREILFLFGYSLVVVDMLLVLISLIIDLSFDLFTKRLHVLLHSPINPFVYQLLNPSPHGLRNVLKIILIHLLVGPGFCQLFGSLPLFLNHGLSMHLLVFLKFLTSIIQFLLSIDSAFVNLIYSSPNLLVVKHRQRPLGKVGCAV